MKVLWFRNYYSSCISNRSLRLRHSVRSRCGHMFHFRYVFNYE